MKSRGMLFSGPMVRAILEGRKTMTRRPMNPQPPEDVGSLIVEEYAPTKVDRNGEEYPGHEIFGATSLDGDWGQKARHAPGDEIWVRETWTQDGRGGSMTNGEDAVYYRADMPDPAPWKGFWKSSMFMPRWASRITLEVTRVRVERLQDISEEDAKAEGCEEKEFRTVVMRPDGGPDYHIPVSYRGAFANLWTNINGPGSWDLNPWTWVYEFRRKA